MSDSANGPILKHSLAIEGENDARFRKLLKRLMLFLYPCEEGLALYDCLSEILANIEEYAYAGKTGWVRVESVETALEGGRAGVRTEMTVYDKGTPVDELALARIKAAYDQNLDSPSGRGDGWFTIGIAADEFDYPCYDGIVEMNRVRVVKEVPAVDGKDTRMARFRKAQDFLKTRKP